MRSESAFPTICLFWTVFFSWVTTLSVATFDISIIAMLTLCSFVIFTPMHDAVHRSISKDSMNTFIGAVSGICMTIPFPAFKYLHLQHHRHLNDSQDPDSWSGKSYPILRWITQEPYYYWYYFSRILTRPVSEVAQVIGILCLFCTVIFLYPSECLKYWILPNRIAFPLLVFAYDYLPHRPHISRDRYKATSVTSIFQMPWLLTIPMLCQNYHNIHHLYPHLPFYKYSKIWYDQNDRLIRSGTRVQELL